MSVPVRITDHRLRGVLEIVWDDGDVSALPHAVLRAGCRCAACEQARRRGEGEPPAADDLRLVRIEPVADKGLNLAFSDGHARGIYPWVHLRRLGAD